MRSDVAVLRFARSRPVLFALFETLLTGGCAVAWYVVAGLLYLESRSQPGGPPTRTFFLLAYAAVLSLPVTWALRGVPVAWLRRIVDRTIMARALASIAVCVAVFAYAMAS